MLQCAVVLAAALAGCDRSVDGASADARGWVPSDSLHEPDFWFAHYQGDGFTFVHPRRAMVFTGTSPLLDIPGVVFSGEPIEVSGKVPQSDVESGHFGPGFEFVVASIPNPGHRTLEAVADSVVAHHNRGFDPGSMGGLATSTFETIAGQRVAVVSPDCGDCRLTEVYFVRADRIVVFAWQTASFDPIDAVTGPLYWYIVSTFRWN